MWILLLSRESLPPIFLSCPHRISLSPTSPVSDPGITDPDSMSVLTLLPLCTAFTTPRVALGHNCASTLGSAIHPMSRCAIFRMHGEPCQDEAAVRADAEAAFRLLDLDGNGEVSSEEMKSYLGQYRYTDAAVEKIYAALDLSLIHI